MRPVVADASALAEYLLRTDRARRVQAVIEAPDVDLHAPALCDVEVASVFRRALRTGRMDEARAGLALEAYLDLPLSRHGHAGLLSRVLALRENFTVYDAVYVALAERLGAEFLSADAGLVRAARRHTDLLVVSAAV
ncbi:MAG: type II toxin-antitoxin system VapC family toxin [Gemmatimonadota bacterium]